MTLLRYLSIIPIVAHMGCATPPRTECSNDDVRNWVNANASTIGKQLGFPTKARREKQEGKVIVAVSVNEDGSVKDVSIKQSSGFSLLDTEALKVAKAKYSSPVCSGQTVPMTADIPIYFKLAD